MTSSLNDSQGKRLRVLMIAEGTYPYHWGGVSTWCHLLFQDLPNIDFALISLIGDVTMTPQFTLPANVIDFRPIPLWGLREVLENRPDLGLAELRQRRAGTTEEVVEQHFVPLFRAFLQDLFAETGSPERLGQVVHRMHRFFLTYDFDTAMRSQGVWRSFVEVAQEGFPRVSAGYGYANARFQLADLTTCMHWLYHWLFPIGAPLPKTDVAHAAMAGICTLVAVAAKLEHGAAFMLTEHGIYLRERYLAEAVTASSLFRKLFSLRFARRMTELSYALADQIAPCCDFNRRWELRNGARAEQIQTIYYGVDATVFAPTHKPFGEPPVVVWVGRIDPLKDLFTLLRAAALVHQARPDIEFRLFGSAPAGNERYYEQCLELRRELGLEETVVFAGFRANTASAFNEGDIAILSSMSEGFPFVVLEAMLCQKPVVASAVGGVPEQVEGCGFVVEPRNPEAMAEAILTLMNDRELCTELGQIAREKALHEYTVRQSGMAHESAYQRLADRRHDRGPAKMPTGQGIFHRSRQRNSLAPQEMTTALQASHQPGNGNGAFNPIAMNLFIPTSLNAYSAADGIVENGAGLHNGQGAAPVTSAVIPTVESPSQPRRYGNGRRLAPVPLVRQTEERTPAADAVATLVSEVGQRDLDPIDSLEITAIIESLGITDEVAAQRYGVPDAFELGEIVLRQMKARGLPARLMEQTLERTSTWRERLVDYVRGPLALAPPLIMLLVIYLYHQWGQWSDRQVLMLSAGITCSMLVVNGFNQGISRRIAIYLGLRKPQLAGRYFWHSTRVGLICALGLALLATAITTRLGIFTTTERYTFSLAFISLSFLWMAGGVLALVQKMYWLSGGLVVGLIAGLLADRMMAPFLAAHVVAGTLVGYSVALALILLALRRGFSEGQGNKPAPATTRHWPSTAYLLDEAAPYFVYGSLFIVMIVLPHLFGWLGALGDGETRAGAITNVELALTLAMPPLILAGGVAEHTLRLFWRLAPVTQAATAGERVEHFRRTMVSFYRQQRKNYLLTLSFVSVLLFVVFRSLAAAGVWTNWLKLPDSEAAFFLFTLSLIAYGLLGLGMFNCMFCITVGRPQLATQALVQSLTVLVLAGVLLSGLSYRYSAFAFICGAATFAILSWWLVNRVWRLLDYYFVSTL